MCLLANVKGAPKTHRSLTYLIHLKVSREKGMFIGSVIVMSNRLRLKGFKPLWNM